MLLISDFSSADGTGGSESSEEEEEGDSGEGSEEDEENNEEEDEGVDSDELDEESALKKTRSSEKQVNNRCGVAEPLMKACVFLYVLVKVEQLVM